MRDADKALYAASTKQKAIIANLAKTVDSIQKKKKTPPTPAKNN